MNKRETISPIFRAVSGMIGILGFAAIALNSLEDAETTLDFKLFASSFAYFVFLYVSIFGRLPWNSKNKNDADQ